MNLESQVSSLELSKKLRDLGVKQQESEFYWQMVGGDRFVLKMHEVKDCNAKCLAAFTVAELGEILRKEYVQYVSALDQQFYCWRDDESATDWKKITQSEFEANSRAKMLVYLIEQGIVKP